MTNTNIKVGTFQGSYPVSALKFSTVNRDIVKNHASNFIRKISKYGWMVPVVIDKDGNLIEGHHRVTGAIEMGLKYVPAYIIDWVDTSNDNEYQDYIMNLNASNRSWNALDYLKTTSINQPDYKYVYDKHIKSTGILTVGNVLNIYFNSGATQTFKDGKSRIKDKDFANYLYENFKNLRATWGNKKIQAFTINRTTQFMYSQCKTLSEVTYIFEQIEMLAEGNSEILSSVQYLKPYLIKQLKAKRS